MTNLQYLNGILSKFGVEESYSEQLLVDASENDPTLAPDLPAVPSKLKQVIYGNLSIILPGIMQNVTEGGYSISWNIDGLKFYYSLLASELGETDVLQPVVSDKSYMA